MNRLIPAFLFLLYSVNLFAQTNFITGAVVDSKTEEPLIGANVLVNELDNWGDATDLNGKFSIKVPNGSYTLTVRMIGYAPVVKTDVIVGSGSEVQLKIKLTETSIQLDQVEVHADYFDKAIKENDLSTVVLSPEEIRRSPGSAQDFQRILQGMPGVSFTDDKNNELLVRGGSPNENLIILDGMEIHSTNHYPDEQNSGGPINMVNVDLIEDIQFSTGGFISKYGDKLSSVMNITSREGTRRNLFNGNINLSMAGFGAVVEGKINNGQGSWVASFRKSYLDLLTGAIGLTAVPKYYDAQFKVVYDLSGSQKLSWSGIYGNDKIFIKGKSDETDKAMAGKIDSVATERVDVKQWQWATGISLKSIWSRSLYSNITLFYNNYHTDLDVVEKFSGRVFDNEGKVTHTSLLNERKIVRDLHNNGQGALKAGFVWNPSKSYELDFGGYLGIGDFKQDLYIFGDSSRYFINGNWTPVVVVPASKLTYNIKLFDNHKDYLYVNNRFKYFSEKLVLNLGLRYDNFSYSDQGNISPRLSASYALVPGLTSINFAYGEYYQTQSYPTYGDREHSDINKYLDNTHARHFILGFEHLLDTGLKLTVEGYYKKYDKIPVSEEFIHYYDRTFRSNKNLTVGKQTTYGIDILLQQKLVKDYYGTLSFSRMWSITDDPRIGNEGNTYPSGYDFPYVISIVFGKRFFNLRDKLDEMPFFIKYPTYILPFSNDMEISFRWRYASGRPFTPRHWTTDEQHYEGETRWSKGSWVPDTDINSERYPSYHRLDIAFNSRYSFGSMSLSVYLSLMNIYGRDNIAFYQYNSDGTIDDVLQFSLLPVVGIEFEF